MRRIASVLAVFLAATLLMAQSNVQIMAPPLSGWNKVSYTAQKATVQTVKATPGMFGGFFISNVGNASTASCVQIFDIAATVTLGTTVPTMVYEVAGGASLGQEFANGVSMSGAIQLAAATTCTGNTAPTTGLNITIYYK